MDMFSLGRTRTYSMDMAGAEAILRNVFECSGVTPGTIPLAELVEQQRPGTAMFNAGMILSELLFLAVLLIPLMTI